MFYSCSSAMALDAPQAPTVCHILHMHQDLKSIALSFSVRRQVDPRTWDRRLWSLHPRTPCPGAHGPGTHCADGPNDPGHTTLALLDPHPWSLQTQCSKCRWAKDLDQVTWALPDLPPLGLMDLTSTVPSFSSWWLILKANPAQPGPNVI